MRIEAGPWADDTGVLRPAGFRREGTAWTWSSGKADLDALSAIVARVEVAAARRQAEIAAWNAGPFDYRLRVAARASSALSGGRYEAANLVDGKLETAWCEGAADDGVGQWFELKADPTGPLPDHCTLEGLALVPGYAKSQEVFANNNRARQVRVGPCGAGAGEVVDLLPGSRFDRSVAVIGAETTDSAALQGLYEAFHADPSKFCARVTIEAVEPGARYHDTCLSEAVALVNCG